MKGSEFEMKEKFHSVNPLFAEKEYAVGDDEIKQDYLGQNPLPWRRKIHTFDPEFFKCDNKIVKFNHFQLGDFRALMSFSHTIVSDGNTWKHLNMLTILCFITMAIVYFTGSFRSINDSSNVSARIQTLISFVFASYISLVINRWDRIRNTTLGQHWGSMENIVLSAIRVIRRTTKQRIAELSAPVATKDNASEAAGDTADELKPKLSAEELEQAIANIEDEETTLINRIVRYGRLTFILTFRAAQGSDDFALIEELKLLSKDEERWLRAAAIGTRPLMVVSWISEYFDDCLPSKGYKVDDTTSSFVITNILSLRGGIGGTLGCIGTQLPYAYVHVITWTIQILLCALSVETGVLLSVYLYMDENGAGNYSPAGGEAWPEKPYVWYVNNFLQVTAGNIIYALFVEGMLNICEKLSNPLGHNEMCFSDRLFDTFFFNNCRSMYAGAKGYAKVDCGDIDSKQSKKLN